MSATKSDYKIGEACKELDVQPYVLRYWETEFPFLRPEKGSSGQRVYSEEELALIRRVKELLYDEGYTIAGAKKKLEAEIASARQAARGVQRVLGEDDDGGPPAAEKKPPKPAQKSTQKSTQKAAQKPVGKGATKGGVDSATPPAEEDRAAETADAIASPSSGAGSLDSRASERIELVARGLRDLRNEAREVLELLQSSTESR